VTRRRFVRTFAVVVGAAAVGVGTGCATGSSGHGKGSRRRFDVRSFGARGDGKTNDTAAIQRAIDATGRAGGGVVLLPAGVFLSGTLTLRSRITVELAHGATLLASPDEHDFTARAQLPYQTYSDFETSDFANALLAGESLEHVAVVGEGTIDANRTKRFGPKPIALRRCKDVRVQGVTIRNAPNYCVSLGGCETVVVEGITIRNAFADGIDPDCCRHVRISHCDIESDDDAVVLKTSLILGKRVPTEDVVVSDCTLRSYANCFKIGTETSGDVRDVHVRNCTLLGTPDRDARRGPRDENAAIAIEMVDGGVLDGVTVSDIVVRDVLTPVFVRLGNRGRGQSPPTPGALRNVEIVNVVADGVSETSSITGIPGHAVAGVAIRGLRIGSRGGVTAPGGLDVPEQEGEYPQAGMFGVLPASGLYARHGRALSLQGLDARVAAADARATVLVDDVADLELDGFTTDTPPSSSPVVRLHDVREGRVRQCRSAARVTPFASVTGAATRGLAFERDHFGAGPDPVELGPDVDRAAVTLTDNA